jgi:hypothetical protein
MILPQKTLPNMDGKHRSEAEKPLQPVRTTSTSCRDSARGPRDLPQKNEKSPLRVSRGRDFLRLASRPKSPADRRHPPLGRGNGRAENQSGSGAGGVLPWNLAGTFPFGGPFTEGPFTEGPLAGGAATGAAETGTAGAAAADGPALAPGATLPGFGTPPAAGAAGASPADATGAGGGAEAGLAPSEHPANPLTATARADVATAHHRQRMGIERDPSESRFCDRPRRAAQARTGRNTHLPKVRADSRPRGEASCHP